VLDDDHHVPLVDEPLTIHAPIAPHRGFRDRWAMSARDACG
jgi:hypothetical protein